MDEYQAMLESVERANEWKSKRYEWAVNVIVEAAKRLEPQDRLEFYLDMLGGGDEIVTAACRRLSNETDV